MQHSEWLTQHRDARNAKALGRVEVAMARLPNVLDRDVVSCQKTLEQKISDQGPSNQRVDPHLLGLAIRELSVERKFLKVHRHPATGETPWFSNAKTPAGEVAEKLDQIAPLYSSVASGQFRNLVGDALEIVVAKSLTQLNNENPRYDYLGAFDFDAPKNKQGRFVKTEPPNTISGRKCLKIPDFFLSGFPFGHVCIECKNLREWIYPDNGLIRDLIRKGIETNTIPCLIARRIHYTTLTNFLIPAGIIAHESYHQYYPSEYAELASTVKQKRLLGFSDVRATEEPDKRTVKFITKDLPAVAEYMAERFRANHVALSAFLSKEMNLAQLYNEIGSPAAGNWVEGVDDTLIPF